MNETEPETCKAAELAKLLGLSPQRIHQLVKNGVLVNYQRGTFDKFAAILTYCEYLRRVVKQQGSGSSNATLKQSRVELLAVQKQNAELNYQQKTGQVLLIDNVEAILMEAAAVFAGQKRSMGSRLSGKLAGMTSPKAILKLLNAENDAILKNTATKFSEIQNISKARGYRKTAAGPKSKRVGRPKSSTAARKPRTRAVAK